MTKKEFFKKEDYVYDEYYDCYLCPCDHILSYSTANQDGYRECKSKGEVCKDCPRLCQCTESKNHVKVVTQHIWYEYLEQAEEIRHTPRYRKRYKLRRQTIERIFAEMFKS